MECAVITPIAHSWCHVMCTYLSSIDTCRWSQNILHHPNYSKFPMYAHAVEYRWKHSKPQVLLQYMWCDAPASFRRPKFVSIWLRRIGTLQQWYFTLESWQLQDPGYRQIPSSVQQVVRARCMEQLREVHVREWAHLPMPIPFLHSRCKKKNFFST